MYFCMETFFNSMGPKDLTEDLALTIRDSSTGRVVPVSDYEIHMRSDELIIKGKFKFKEDGAVALKFSLNNPDGQLIFEEAKILSRSGPRQDEFFLKTAKFRLIEANNAEIYC